MEFALCLPLVVVLVLGVLNVAAIVGDQLALELAAREGARAAAVSATPSAAARAAVDRVIAPGGRPGAVAVQVDDGAAAVTVSVSATSAVELPIVGRLIAPVRLEARATMAVEPPG